MATARKPRDATAAQAKAAKAPVAAGAVPSGPQPAAEPELSAADRENPAKLSGDALRRLAHQRGIARSEAESMSDEKLRMQLNYIINRQYAEAD